jgi:hypothetical protein
VILLRDQPQVRKTGDEKEQLQNKGKRSVLKISWEVELLIIAWMDYSLCRDFTELSEYLNGNVNILRFVVFAKGKPDSPTL